MQRASPGKWCGDRRLERHLPVLVRALCRENIEAAVTCADCIADVDRVPIAHRSPGKMSQIILVPL